MFGYSDLVIAYGIYPTARISVLVAGRDYVRVSVVMWIYSTRFSEADFTDSNT
jgi:hypothetical protein